MEEKTKDAYPPCGCEAAGEAVNLYVDGELPIGEQSMLFAHLSACEDCRLLLESVLQFRRMGRLESVAVPPAVDEAFLRRLDRHKADRPPVARMSRDRSLRRSIVGAALCAMLFIMGGLWMTGAGHPEPQVPLSSEGVDPGVASVSQVIQEVHAEREPLYVFYPGLTVVASRMEEIPSAEQLSSEQLFQDMFFPKPVPAETLPPDLLAPEPLAPEAL